MIPRRFHPPQPIAVWLDDDGAIERFIWQRRERRVALTEATWRQDHGWWQGEGEALSRDYRQLRTTAGLVCVVYRDLLADRWYLEQVLD